MRERRPRPSNGVICDFFMVDVLALRILIWPLHRRENTLADRCELCPWVRLRADRPPALGPGR
jgi:hypothetical protein